MTRRAAPWWLAAAFVVAMLLAPFAEALVGRAAIDPAVNLPHTDPAYRAGVPDPSRTRFDPSPELAHQPWDDLIIRTFRQGRLPLWQTGNGLGTPLLANGQAAPFNPLKLLMWQGSLGAAFAWFLALRLVLAGLGTLLLARRLGVGSAGAAAAGLAFAACGFFGWHFQFPDTHALVWLPWVLLAGERFLAEPNGRHTALLGVLIGLMGLAGHPEAALFGALGAAAVVLARAASEPRLRPARLGGFALASLVALGVAAVGVFPFLDLARQSYSYHLARDASAFGAMFEGLGPWQVWRQVFRHAFSAIGAEGHNYNLGIGTAGLLLAGFGLAQVPVRRVALPLLVAGLLALLVLPPGNLLPAPPVAANNFYVMAVPALGLALLAGAGIDRLLPARGRVVAMATASAGVLAAVAARVALGDQAITGRPDWDWAAVAGVLALVPLVVAAWRRPAWAPACRALAAVLVGLQGVAALRYLNPPRPALAAYERPLHAWLRTATPAGRVAGGGVMLPDVHAATGLETPELMEAFLPRRFVTYFEALNQDEARRGVMFLVRPTADPLWLDLANVGWLLVRPDGQPAGLGPLVAAQPERYALATTLDGVAVYQNRTALPRAWVAYDAAFVADDRDGLAAARAVTALGPAARRKLVVETADGLAPAGWTPDPAMAPSAAAVVRRAPNEVVVQASLARPGWLFLADGWHPGWTATVGGRPLPILPADTAFRAVLLPAGRHEVAFVYAPPVVAWSLGLSGLTLLGCFGAIARRRRPERPGASDDEGQA